MKLPLALCFASLILNACDEHRSLSEREALPELLTPVVLELQANENFDECIDTEDQLSVAQALDERFDDIRQFMMDHPSTGFNTVELGPLSVHEQIGFQQGIDEWKTRGISWSGFIDDWKKIADTPVDEKWVRLSMGVRGILVDDQNRILNDSNYGINRQQVPYIKGIEEALRQCVDTNGCLNPDFTEAEEKVIAANPVYNAFNISIREESGRDTLKKWAHRVKLDLWRFETRVYPGVTFNGGMLEVPMFSDLLMDAEAALAEYIESVWRNEEFGVKIKWLDSKMQDQFTFVLDNDVGGRAFVSWSDKTLHVSDGVRSRTFPHEFGHVLGLRDEYYTSWDSQICTYLLEQNSGNIMSKTDSGVVTSELFAFLKTTYGQGEKL